MLRIEIVTAYGIYYSWLIMSCALRLSILGKNLEMKFA